MNNLNNRPETRRAPAQQAVPQTPLRQRGMNFLTRVEGIGEDRSRPGSAILRASAAEDMSAASSRSRMDDALETNTGSWKEILNEWVNSCLRSPDIEIIKERANRKIAAERISACIRKNGGRLDFSNLKLSSLPPVLHHCKALKTLTCTNNKLTQLNLEDCSGLTKLYCNNNKLAQLNLKGCKALEALYCIHNQLAQLDLEGCKALTKVYCNNNQLAQLNLKDCQALKVLHCSNNQLTQLNLEGCNDLRHLACRGNRLTRLNFEGCNRLQYLFFTSNDQLRFDNLDFLLEMGGLSHIEFTNTAIGWHQLPEAIRNNQAIFIDIRPQRERHQALNAAQNTHTESIHQCASQNALALKSKNSTQNLKQAYLEFCEWINQRPADGAAVLEGYANDRFKNLTAKEWIASPQHLEHRDRTSGVSVKEFLALAWRAAKDPEQREPHVPEAAAKEVLVDALYEIRRGYNLDAAHNPKDNGEAARNICAGGTFNKISEKLVSVIQGTTSFMVTSETFQLSLTSTIKKAIEALRKDNPVVDDELKENGNLLTAPVWEKIKTGVIASIKEEFKNYPKIAGKDLDQHIREQTDYEQVLQYFSVS